MSCQWQMFLNLLPHWMREPVDRHGRDTLQELRLRMGGKPQLITSEGQHWLNRDVTTDDLDYCINAASRYSPWSAVTLAQGYITASGGHRIGVMGRMAIKGDCSVGVQTLSSLCLRVARDFPGIARDACCDSSYLIIGPPGSGKTTFLRDLIRQISNRYCWCISVIDEKGEIFPLTADGYGFPIGKQTDVMTGCPKKEGIEIAIRNMGPEMIAVDEVTAEEDCRALVHAGWCGVKLLATAHAVSREDLQCRAVYKPLIRTGLFEKLIIMHPDKTWQIERMVI